MKIASEYRNQYTTLDAKKAKNRVQRLCIDCGAGLKDGMGGRNRCSPCQDIRLQKQVVKYIAKRREKAKASRI